MAPKKTHHCGTEQPYPVLTVGGSFGVQISQINITGSFVYTTESPPSPRDNQRKRDECPTTAKHSGQDMSPGTLGGSENTKVQGEQGETCQRQKEMTRVHLGYKHVSLSFTSRGWQGPMARQTTAEEEEQEQEEQENSGKVLSWISCRTIRMKPLGCQSLTGATPRTSLVSCDTNLINAMSLLPPYRQLHACN